MFFLQTRKHETTSPQTLSGFAGFLSARSGNENVRFGSRGAIAMIRILIFICAFSIIGIAEASPLNKSDYWKRITLFQHTLALGFRRGLSSTCQRLGNARKYISETRLWPIFAPFARGPITRRHLAGGGKGFLLPKLRWVCGCLPENRGRSSTL